mgnify:CR=1 FL=1
MATWPRWENKAFMAPTARLRRRWLDVRLRIGVGLLIAFIPLSVTGSILAWRDQLDRALYAERYATTGPTASRNIKDYAQAARRTVNDAEESRQAVPEKRGGAYTGT